MRTSELTDLEKMALLYYVERLPEEINLIYVSVTQKTFVGESERAIKIERLRFGDLVFSAGYEEETKTLVIGKREV